MLVRLDRVSFRDGGGDAARGPSTHTPLVGRSELTQWLSEIARRGFGTIAVVGRRGVGKTRVLRAMLDHAIAPSPAASPPAAPADEAAGSTPGVDEDEQDQSAIGVWISVPTTYSEQDFVRTLHERLAENVESAMSRRLRVLPLASRHHLHTLRSAELLAAGLLFVLFLFATYQVTAYHGVQSAVFLMPFVFVAVAGGLLIASIGQIPPVNLSRWILQDADSASETGMQAALLYRAAIESISTLRPKSLAAAPRRWSGTIDLASGVVVGLLMLAYGIVDEYRDVTLAQVSVNIVYAVFAGLAAYALLAFSRGTLARVRAAEESGRVRAVDEAGASLSSRVAEYRDFAEAVVFRLKLLNRHDPSKQRVVICLDELDKIVDPLETRAFLRRMKGLFEIRGVYYFISLAEDAQRSLVAGSSLGKDEVDSSVDHIRHVGPLDAAGAERLAAEYLQRTAPPAARLDGESPIARNFLLTYITIASAGVPRDVLRLIDQWITFCTATTRPISDPTAFAMQFAHGHLVAELNAFAHAGLVGRPLRLLAADDAEAGLLPSRGELARMVCAVFRERPGRAGADLLEWENLQRALTRLYVLLAALDFVTPTAAPWTGFDEPAAVEGLRQLAYAVPLEPVAQLSAVLERLESSGRAA